jgi:hypothetical protein
LGCRYRLCGDSLRRRFATETRVLQAIGRHKNNWHTSFGIFHVEHAASTDGPLLAREDTAVFNISGNLDDRSHENQTYLVVAVLGSYGVETAI